MGTYKPFPIEFPTFGKLYQVNKEKKDKGKTQWMGTEIRFKDPKKSKSAMTVNVPGAGHYPLIAEWPGKIVKVDDKKKKKLDV